MEAMNMAKMSLVNEVKNLTTKDPWKQETMRAMRMTQKLIQVLQTRNSTSAFWGRFDESVAAVIYGQN
jgi:hypothetical protein